MRILLLSTADTDLLAARASGADYRLANPRGSPPTRCPPCSTGSPSSSYACSAAARRGRTASPRCSPPVCRRSCSAVRRYPTPS
ncbi:hypothetical protein NKG94_10670 [Micromonospora sp. M12]